MPYVHSFAKTFASDFMLMNQGKISSYTTLQTKENLAIENIHRTAVLVLAPELNPIEHTGHRGMCPKAV